MPQLQQLVLTDRAATPVAHTFVPRDINQGVGTVIETNGTPIGNSRFSVSLRQTANGRFKAELKLAVPVTADSTVNGVTQKVVLRTGYADAQFTFEPTSTEQERNDIVGMFASALSAGSTLVNDTVVKLQGVY